MAASSLFITVWARWYCRAKYLLHHGLPMDRLTEPLYWYATEPSSAEARQQASAQLWRWVVWALLVMVSIQTFFYLRDLPRQRDVEAEWSTFPWFPALWAQESLRLLPSDAMTHWLVVLGLLVGLGVGCVALTPGRLGMKLPL
jgi:hypothetical protein